ncbi:MAG: MFS transporter [Propionibacteriaceae bacterium]|nr:MFS transporter [Propionibacteriaceae bacterium]
MKLDRRTWLVIVLLGLSGQIAWNVENSWFNTFVYDEITPDPRPIAAMVAVSAIVATVTTLVMGAWSDRLRRRKPFIVIGYLLWGLSVAVYPAAAEARAVTLAVILVILLDAVMTFFGSTANDAAFNAWVTDATDEHNRGRVDGVLQVMPVLATMIGMGASGFLIDAFGYTPFFLTLGGVVLVMGVVGGLLLRDHPPVGSALDPAHPDVPSHPGSRVSSDPGVGIPSHLGDGKLCTDSAAQVAPARPAVAPNSRGKGKLCRDSAVQVAPARPAVGVRQLIVYEFSPAQIRANADLFLVFTAMLIFSTGVQITFPYEVIYLNHTLGIDKGTVGVITAMVAPVLVLFAWPIGALTDRGRGYAVLLTGFLVAAAGTALFSMASSVVGLTVMALVKSVGFLMMIVLMAWHRHLLPPDARGVFQGIRLIFMVLLPMVIGPQIGSALIRAFGEPAVVDGQAGHQPPGLIYLVGAAVVALSVLPVLALRIRRRGLPPGSPA